MVAIKSKKAPGQDNLNAELFKAEQEFAAQVLQPLFAAIWEEKQIPDDWTGFQRKEPCMSNCENLLSAPSKVIIRQISETVDQ